MANRAPGRGGEPLKMSRNRATKMVQYELGVADEHRTVVLHVYWEVHDDSRQWWKESGVGWGGEGRVTESGRHSVSLVNTGWN